MLLSDHADHITRARDVKTLRVLAHNERHRTPSTPQPGNHVKRDVVLARNRKVASRDITKSDAGFQIRNVAAQPGVDAHRAHDVLSMYDDHMAHPIPVL